MAAKPRDFTSPKYIEFRTKVFKRDGYICQMPKCKGKHRKAFIQAHHIKRVADFPELEYSDRDAITLCLTCHRMVTKFEEDYEELFYGILRSKSSTYFSMLGFKYGADKQEGDGDEPQTEG